MINQYHQNVSKAICKLFNILWYFATSLPKNNYIQFQLASNWIRIKCKQNLFLWLFMLGLAQFLLNRFSAFVQTYNFVSRESISITKLFPYSDRPSHPAIRSIPTGSASQVPLDLFCRCGWSQKSSRKRVYNFNVCRRRSNSIAELFPNSVRPCTYVHS